MKAWSTDRLHQDVERRQEMAYRGGDDQGHLLTRGTVAGFETARYEDASGRVVLFYDEANAVYAYQYDALGRLRQVVLPDGKTHRADYDGHGRVSQVERQDFVKIAYSYVPHTGLPAMKQFYFPQSHVEQRRTSWTYDGIGRVLTEAYYDPATQQGSMYRFYYDGAGQLGESPVSDNVGMLTGVEGPGYRKAFRYRAADGQPLSQFVLFNDGKRVRFDYEYFDDASLRTRRVVAQRADLSEIGSMAESRSLDPWGRPVLLLNADGLLVARVVYNADDQIQAAYFANGDELALSYDPVSQRRVGKTHKTAAWTSSSTIAYNNRGFIGQEMLSVGGTSLLRSYDYSQQGFLTASSDAQNVYRYQYQGFGLPQSIEQNGVLTTLTRNAPFLETSSGGFYQFDNLGRLIKKSGLILNYGPNGQLASAQLGEKQWSYLYDESGRRIAKVRNGQVAEAYLDGLYLDATAIVAPVRIAGELVGVFKNGVFTSLASDHRGTIMADADGTPRIASPYGARDTHPDMAAALDYVEKGYDADLGLVRMGMRDYDPAINQFVQPDPLFLEVPKMALKGTVEPNLYVYARNNPVNFIDPTGLGDEQGSPQQREKSDGGGGIPEYNGPREPPEVVVGDRNQGSSSGGATASGGGEASSSPGERRESGGGEQRSTERQVHVAQRTGRLRGGSVKLTRIPYPVVAHVASVITAVANPATAQVVQAAVKQLVTELMPIVGRASFILSLMTLESDMPHSTTMASNPTTPAGRPYTDHVLDDHPERAPIPGMVIDVVIDSTPGVPAEGGKTVHYDPANDVTVVTGDGGSIVSVRRGPPRPGQKPPTSNK